MIKQFKFLSFITVLLCLFYIFVMFLLFDNSFIYYELVQHGVVGLALKHNLAGVQLVQHAPDGPHVGRAVVFAAEH